MTAHGMTHPLDHCICKIYLFADSGSHKKFNRQVRVDKPPTYLLIEELRDESLTIVLELKEISAGLSTLNKRFKYEKVHLWWGGAWDRLDQDPCYSKESLNMAYHDWTICSWQCRNLRQSNSWHINYLQQPSISFSYHYHSRTTSDSFSYLISFAVTFSWYHDIFYSLINPPAHQK